MSLFEDFNFFVWVAVFSVPAIILGIKEKSIRYYGFVVTLFFIWMAMKSNPITIGYLGGYCVLQLILVKLFAKITQRSGRKKLVYWTFILLSLSPLIIYKISALFEYSLLGFIGISYMTFKSVQVIIEIYDGLIQKTNSFEFINFLLFFPCFLSGPIDRSRRFSEDFSKPKSKKEYLELVGTGLYKICLGIVYKFVFSSAFYQGILWLGMKNTIESALIYMYSYGFYLYFDFAGYSLMAIGISYIFGIATPDNFHKPFVSTDMKDFWNRWHISLSYWFRDFIFSRFMMKSIKGKWFKNKLTGASIGFMINMTVMGCWHGLTVYYIMYGVYHGILLALTEIYQKKSKFHKKHKKETWYKAISWFVTFNLVMFGFFIFSGRFTELIGII